ncbi:MAG: 50S ribosomal protein L25 [Saprospiraceae bacterium]|nr:50S ribosomal protein L25 [Saprospiraceae bacterium]
MNYIQIAGESRDLTGKKASKAVRNNGAIPCCIYGEQNINFSTTEKHLRTLVYTPDFKLADITIDGKSYKCILKDIQFHPTSEAIVHVDFQELIPKRPIKVEIPVRLTGVAKGVKNGGKMLNLLRRIKVKTTPEQLVDELFADVTHLTLGQAMRVKEVQVPEGIEILVAPNIPICQVEIPRALRSATAAEEEAEAAAAAGGEAPAEVEATEE